MVAAAPVRPGDVSFSAAEANDRVSYLSRWLRVWIAVLVLTTLVVVGYLIVIGWSLQSIANNLGGALDQVRGVRQDVNALPTQVDTVNSSLSRVAAAVKPLPGDINTTNSALTRVNTNLASTTTSLRDIAGSLGDTTNLLSTTTGRLRSVNGALSATAPTLVSVHHLAQDIQRVLDNAESPADQLGTKDIYQNVGRVNAALAPAHHETGEILAELLGVNKHLTSICRSPLLSPLGAAPPC